ncbi:MAG: hypothetical protein AAGE89_04750 [Pseudomonadota bacterium]
MREVLTPLAEVLGLGGLIPLPHVCLFLPAFFYFWHAEPVSSTRLSQALTITGRASTVFLAFLAFILLSDPFFWIELEGPVLLLLLMFTIVTVSYLLFLIFAVLTGGNLLVLTLTMSFLSGRFLGQLAARRFGRLGVWSGTK